MNACKSHQRETRTLTVMCVVEAMQTRPFG